MRNSAAQGDHHPDMDVFAVAKLVLARALESHGEDIDLVGYYGSYAQGSAGPDSDLDLFYIPADGKNPQAARSFLFQGRLFDFWAIGWEDMRGFATGANRGWLFAPALVHHTRVLYARTETSAARFLALQHLVRDQQRPEARAAMIERAVHGFQAVLAQLGNLRLAVLGADISDLRHAGWQLILAALECLALANQVFFDRGLGHILEQIARLPEKPEGLHECILTISTSSQPELIARAAEQLVLETRGVLLGFQRSAHREQTVQTVFSGTYPETKDALRKLQAACHTRHSVAASAAAWAVQTEHSLMLSGLHQGNLSANFNLYSEFALEYRQRRWPELMRVSAEDFSGLAQLGLGFDTQLRQWLQRAAIPLCEFETLEALNHWLQT